MIYIGVDPGKSGGIAWIQDGRKSTVAYSDEALLNLCRQAGGEECICCLEKVSAMPKQGVTSMFNFGVSFGFIKGVLTAFEMPYQEIPPQKWKKEYSLNSDKQNSIAVCKKLFPDVNLKRTDKCRVDHDGMAEALLMAEYARRRM